MAKRILYKNHCVPLEQISVDGKYYLDSDCGQKLKGTMLLDLGAGAIIAGELLVSGDLGGPDLDFLAVSVVKANVNDEVFLSFDNNSTIPIQLLQGEAFVSQISNTSEPYVRIGNTSGEETQVSYMTGVVV